LSRVAAIDIGTNTILLLVLQGDRVLRDEAEIVRLGEGVDRSRALKPEAIARARICLEKYAGFVKGADRIAVVGTSAMRDAGGSEQVGKIVRDLFGVDLRVISGDEEARLTFAGGISGLNVTKPAGVFDIGGGSTEIVIDGSFKQSFDIGSVRLTERHVKSDPPTKQELLDVSRAATEALSSLPKFDGTLIGIAGTVTTLVAILLGLDPYDGARVHGRLTTRAEIQKLQGDLAAMPLAKRRSVRGLEPKRADVIVQGAAIVLAVLDALGKTEFLASDRGLRWGLAQELARG